jgi:hypothetical protein
VQALCFLKELAEAERLRGDKTIDRNIPNAEAEITPP